MSDRPSGDKFDFDDFCAWLDLTRRERSGSALLRQILGQSGAADLDDVLARMRRLAAGMTPDERHDPQAIPDDRRAQLAAEVRVNPTVVSDLFLRFGAAAQVFRIGRRDRSQGLDCC